MKTMMMAMMALALTSTAHAGYYATVLTCTDQNAGPDHGFSLKVTEYNASLVGRPVQPQYFAEVSEDTFAGRQVLGNYEVTFQAPQHGSAGSSGAWVGQDFSLSFPVVPTHNHAYVANLSFSTQDQLHRAASLLCTGQISPR
jgi:hypothetical protein